MLEHSNSARLGWGKNLMKFSDYVSDPLSEWASEVDDRTLANPPQTLCNALLWWFWIWGSIIALTTAKMTKRHFVWSSLCGDCVRQLSVGIPRHSTSGRSAVPHRGHTGATRGPHSATWWDESPGEFTQLASHPIFNGHKSPNLLAAGRMLTLSYTHLNIFQLWNLKAIKCILHISG